MAVETLQVSCKKKRIFCKFYAKRIISVIDETKRTPLIKSIVPMMREKVRKSCTKKMLHKRLPILNWLPKYNSQDAIGDLVAGITVGLTVIPQSLAYSTIAGLPTQVIYLLKP